jgi:lipoprotein-anchoring transpeptidase ErfK/SrfK
MKKWQYILTLLAFIGIFLLASPDDVFADTDCKTPQVQSSIMQSNPNRANEPPEAVKGGYALESNVSENGEKNTNGEKEEKESSENNLSLTSEPTLQGSDPCKAPVQDNSKASAAYGKTIADGTYVIAPKDGGIKVLDGGGASSEPGSGIKVSDAFGSSGQKFAVKWNEAGYYTFQNVETGYYLGLSDTVAASGSPVVQFKENAENEAQKWYIAETESGDYRIISRVNGRVLSVPADSYLIQAQNLTGEDSESFSFRVAGENTDFKDSVYEISCSEDEQMVLDITQGSMAPKGNLQVYNRNETEAQRFILTYAGNDQWTLTSLKSGNILDIKDGSKASGATIWQYSNTSGKSQRWFLRNTGEGSCYIVSALNPKNAFTIHGTCASKASICNETLYGSESQKFSFHPVNYTPPLTGEFTFYSRVGNDLILDIADGRRQIQANLQIYQNNDSLQQKFIIQDKGNGFVTIMNANSGHLLDVQNGSRSSYGNIWQYQDNGTPAQLWIVHKNPNDTYSFINAQSSMTMTVAYGFADNYTNVVQNPYQQNSLAQEFVLRRASGINSRAKDYSRYYDPVDQKAQQEYSDTNYVMILDQNTHLLSIYIGSRGHRIRITRFLISDGAPESPTPTGRYRIIGRVGSFGDGYTCWYATNFYGNYFFHSVIYAPGSKTEIYDGRLGMCISHGCVRSKINCAKWIYDTVPNGSKIYIY